MILFFLFVHLINNSVVAANNQQKLAIDTEFSQQAYIIPADVTWGDELGASVAISGDTMVIGLPGKDFWDGSTLIAEDAGAAYVFTRSKGVWNQQGYLTASTIGDYDQFGKSVAISGDTIVVGARGESSPATGVNGNETLDTAFAAGAAYVFVRTGTDWNQQAYLKASNADERDNFGVSVAISNDTIVVGALFESSNSRQVDGPENNNLAESSGAAYIFTRTDNTWSQQAYLKASNADDEDIFGFKVAISGDTVVVGATGESSNNINNANNNNSNRSGAAYVFNRTGNSWAQQSYLKASNIDNFNRFGYSVGISGETLVIGASGVANNTGAAYVFNRINNNWSQQAYLQGANSENGDSFGHSVSISHNILVIGAQSEDSDATGVNGIDNNSASASGAAYVFARSGTTWNQQDYLKASNTHAGDVFGRSVAISGRTLVVGAPLRTFVSGRAYVFSSPGHSIGGSISGLANGNNLTLQNNLDDNLIINTNGSFTFDTPLDDNEMYDVTILLQPTTPKQTCAIVNNNGTLAGSDITNITITCNTAQYTIGGIISGLTTGSSMVLQNNLTDNLIIDSNGSFTFDTALDDSEMYGVTVLMQPTAPNQTCLITGGNSVNNNGTGTLTGVAETSIVVTCNTEPVVLVDSYTAFEDEILIIDVNGVLANDTDVETDLLSVHNPGAFTANGIGGLVTLASNGTFTYNPPTDTSGIASLNFDVTDGINIVASSLTVEVFAVNDQPSFGVIEDVDATNLVGIGNTQIQIENFIENIVLGPNDENTQHIQQFDLAVSDSNSILTNISLANTGTLNLDFSLNFGVALVQIKLQDDGGTANGGVDTSEIIEFTVAHLDLIFADDFEFDSGFRLFDYIDSLNTNEYMNKLPKYDFESDSLQYHGHKLHLWNDYGSVKIMQLVRYWIYEILLNVNDIKNKSLFDN